MERSEILAAMGELKLYGMKAAFDDIMATAVKRQHEPQRVVGDLLKAEINEKQARSIKYQLTIAKLPLAKDLDGFEFDGTPINETLVNDLAGGGFIEQSDGTSWMAMYSLTMLVIAFELAEQYPHYEDVASKFVEHFVYIVDAMNNRGGKDIELWDEEDGFYYDVLHMSDSRHVFMKVRSMVGLIPLFAVQTLEPEMVNRFPGFNARMQWFLDFHPNTANLMDTSRRSEQGLRRLLSIPTRERLLGVLKYMLAENEFLSPYGLRAISAHHREHPYELDVEGTRASVDY